MIVKRRPTWRRWSSNQLRIRQLQDSILEEQRHFLAGDDAYRALSRAFRALETAGRTDGLTPD